MEESSLRILAQAGLSGVFFAAKILRGELPHYRLPLPEFAAKILPCSAPLNMTAKQRVPSSEFRDLRLICEVYKMVSFSNQMIMTSMR